MDRTYDVFCGSTRVGKVRLQRQGLYEHLECRCRLEQPGMYRLVMHCSGGSVKIGLLRPEGDFWTLQRKIPVKQLEAGEMEFFLEGDNEKLSARFIPVNDSKSFEYLTFLQNAKMAKRDGVIGILLDEKR